MDILNSPVKIESAIQSHRAGNSLCIPSVDSAPTINGNGFAEVNPRRRAKTILLVEDEEFVRRLTGEVLESAGYVLVIAASAAEALKICRKYFERVDLLLADVVMPGLSGRELAAEFRNLYPSAEVLLMSGYPEQLALCSLSAGKQRYLAKPFSVDLLLQRVRAMLEV